MIKKNTTDLFDKYKFLTEDGIDLDNRIIYVFGDLTHELGTILRIKYATIKLYYEQERKEKFKNIILNICSGGGEIYAISAALDFYDELKFKDNVLVDTFAQGVCMSAATIILAGGTGERTASKRCRIMLHDIQTEGVGGTATQVSQFAKDLALEQDEFFRFYVIYTRPKNLPELSEIELKKEVKKWKKKFADKSIDNYLSATEAQVLNLIDKVV